MSESQEINQKIEEENSSADEVKSNEAAPINNNMPANLE